MSNKYRRFTRGELRDRFHYDPETGIWTRRYQLRNGPPVGSRADCTVKGRFYRHVRIDKIRYPVGRLAIFYMTGKWPPLGVDHKDGNPGNNRWDNLRPADQSQNLANARLRKNNKSGQRGVSWSTAKQKWVARIVWQRKIYSLGYYKNKDAAIHAYRTAAPFFFGEFMRND